MNLLIGMLIFLPFITIIISLHELAHLTTARRFGMKIREYFVGFGPRLWSMRRGETEYGVKWLLLGGYVKIEGMNPFEEVAPEDLPRTYGAKPIWQRALTVFAGPGSHFPIAAVIFAAGLFFFGDPNVQQTVVISGVEPTLNGSASPAREAGLRPGDTIVSVGDIEQPSNIRLIEVMTAQAEDNPGEPIDLGVERAGQAVSVRVTPELAEVEGQTIGRVGVTIDLRSEPQSFGASMVGGVKLVWVSVEDSFSSIGRVFGPEGVGRVFTLLFTDAPRQNTDAISAVGISQQVGAVSASGGWDVIFYLFGFVTVFIGLINLLPLPPFDGGHLAMLGIEKLRGGKPVDMRKVIPVSAVVMAFFVTFVIATVFLDITKPISP
jgi:membrane-associated protease RseP (regulator of RpoE activity)